MANDEDNKPEDNDPIVEAHLREAQDNSLKNAQLLNDSLKKYPEKGGAINIGDLLGRLGQAKEEQDQEEKREEEEAERKYKNLKGLCRQTCF